MNLVDQICFLIRRSLACLDADMEKWLIGSSRIGVLLKAWCGSHSNCAHMLCYFWVHDKDVVFVHTLLLPHVYLKLDMTISLVMTNKI